MGRMTDRLKAADVVVIGAGVIGLTIAVKLMETGRSVTVLTDREPVRTTSAAAGAMLGISGTPPEDPATRWTEIATPVFDGLAETPASGVHHVYGRIVTNFADQSPPWATALPNYRALSWAEHAGFRSGMAVMLPFADMPAYLGYLHSKLVAGGGHLELRHVTALSDVAGGPPLVNATGIGARELCADDSLSATRGIHVVVNNVGIEEFWMEAVSDSTWTNIFPYPSHIVLGGAALAEEDQSDDEVAADIVARAIAVEPRLAEATVLGRQVGWRPTRPSPRVELDEVDGTPCVHAYGHGGIGVTVSWGVAEDVVRLLNV